MTRYKDCSRIESGFGFGPNLLVWLVFALGSFFSHVSTFKKKYSVSHSVQDATNTTSDELYNGGKGWKIMRWKIDFRSTNRTIVHPSEPAIARSQRRSSFNVTGLRTFLSSFQSRYVRDRC